MIGAIEHAAEVFRRLHRVFRLREARHAVDQLPRLFLLHRHLRALLINAFQHLKSPPALLQALR